MPASKVDSDDDESILFDDELDSTIALEGSSILE
jgi:hypothetical protein